MWQMIRQFLNTKQYLYYIGRHDILPPPLKGQQEKEIIEKAVSGDQKARDLLIEHNLRLVVYVAKRYDNSANCPLEDLISIGTIGLVKAINTFKADKNIKLATYASRCIENEILMYLRQNKKRQNDISLQESVGIDKEGNEVTLEEKLADEGKSVEEITALKMTVEKLYKIMKERLTPRELEIVILRYGLNGQKPVTQREIAKTMGISRSYVSRIETRALSKLKDL